MSELALQTVNLVKRFGGILATDRLNLDVKKGELHAVIGPNGAGKTTLISQISGMLQPDEGVINLNGRNITRTSMHARSHFGLARSFQVTSVFKDFSCVENIALAIQAHSGHSFNMFKTTASDTKVNQEASRILSEVGLSEYEKTPAGSLAHGEQRQLEMGIVLATQPSVLLLDEPMAGMGAEDSTRMIAYLNTLKGKYTILLVEHDMDAVFSLADTITVMVFGSAIASGNPASIRRNERVQKAYLGDDPLVAD